MCVFRILDAPVLREQLEIRLFIYNQLKKVNFTKWRQAESVCFLFYVELLWLFYYIGKYYYILCDGYVAWREFHLIMIIHVIPIFLKMIIHIIKLPSLMITFSANSQYIIFFDEWCHMSLWLDRHNIDIFIYYIFWDENVK